MITAEIVAIGSELLLGGRTDTNSVFLSDLLAEQGIEVRFKGIVGDCLDEICATLTTAAKRAQVILVTGGLGPTADDLSREAMSKLTGRSLRFRRRVYETIKTRFHRLGRPLSPNQRRQAYFPIGSDLLLNSEGTAPGFSFQWNGCRFFCLPGVSHEAKKMFVEAVVPILEKEELTAPPIRMNQIHTFGLMEGMVDRKLQGIFQDSSPIRMGLLASPLGVTITLIEGLHQSKPLKISKRNRVEREKNKELLQIVFKKVCSRLGPYVYGRNRETMEGVIAQQLIHSGFTLSLAESCTGGLIGHRLTQISGSSAFLERGVVCYSNQSKMDLIGVPKAAIQKFGAVSVEVAEAMARGIRIRSHTHLGLSVTGIAGPTGGSPDKPVGLVFVGLSTPRSTYSKEFHFHGPREMVKLRSSQAALDTLRRWLFQLPVLE